ncbi:MAG: alpha/beta fold hydrolase [Acidobacteria bacterium]|nr:alpha/beta fold hydrolase [Acidobacteriota bacterium]
MKLILPVLGVILVLVLLVSGLVYHSITTPERASEVVSPGDYHLAAEDVSWSGAGGEPIEGWYFRSSNLAPLIIICHGYGSDRSNNLGLAARLKESGFNVLLFNLRGHGTASQKHTTLGWKESQDLRGSMDMLIQRPEVDFRRIGLYGVDIGAYAAMHASRDNPNIKALALDSVFHTIDDFIAIKVKQTLGIKTSVISYLVTLCHHLFSGSSPAETGRTLPPETFADKRMLFIASSDQKSASLSRETRRLYTYFSCQEKEILHLPFPKSQLFGPDRYKYDENILDFFKKELLAPSSNPLEPVP